MRNALLVLLVALIALGSFVAGARIGTWQHYLAEAQYRASVGAGNLRLIEQNRLDDLRTSLEINVDGDIARHSDYLDSNWKWLWPELGRDDRGISSAVKYRVGHPFTGPDLSNLPTSASLTPDQLSFATAVAADYKLDLERKQRMIEKYRER